ncbi:hypothetical protein FB45DRAFT_936212 [Roridomyces roridus]|uniref:Uncharacterized protein n=1 Tax=Roridomyces roridus TaxID=1738132 RepID=A0AAD7BA59_9AGAR|nr:hypothetical protein FB45DRAFT_936212 [Roridomyces roridus]
MSRIIDADPEVHLEDCSTDQLIDMAKRMVLGPKTWSPTHKPGPQLEREVLVCFPENQNPGENPSVRLLPGGKYFTLCLDGGDELTIWEVGPTARCIWRLGYRISAWSVEISDSHEDTAMVIFHVLSATNTRSIQIIEVNLLTGESTDVLRLPLPEHIQNSSRTTLLGDLFLLCLWPEILFVGNWRQKTYAWMRVPTGALQASLLPGHIAITCANRDFANKRFLSVYALSSLRWKLIQGLPTSWDPMPWDIAHQIITETIPFASAHKSEGLELRVYKHPIFWDAYRVTLHMSSNIPNLPLRRTGLQAILWGQPSQLEEDTLLSELHSYFFYLPQGSARPEWHKLSVIPTMIPAARTLRMSPELTFSGYGLDTTHVSTSFVDACRERDGVVQSGYYGRRVRNIRICSADMPLGVYSAAVLELEKRALTILYFV